LNKAVDAFFKALNVYDAEKYVANYATALQNLGNAFSSLAEVRDPEANLMKSSDMYESLLELYTIEDFPIKYASAQNDLGNVHVSLFTFHNHTLRFDRASSYSWNIKYLFYLKAAIQNFQEALKIRKRNEYPIDYAYTQKNLGIAYKYFAQIQLKEANSMNATRAFEEALAIFTVDEYPLIHQQTVLELEGIKK
jgi:tetratricopeptide (TPR) repeat protein